MKQQLASVQATLDTVQNRTMVAGNINSDHSHRPMGLPLAMPQSEQGQWKPIDSLAAVNIVPNSIVELVRNDCYVNLASILVAGTEVQNETRVIEDSGQQIVIKANDASYTQTYTEQTEQQQQQDLAVENEPIINGYIKVKISITDIQ